MPDLNCTYRPSAVKCNGFDPRAFRWAQTMRLAVEEINQSKELLPNHTLGYKIFDSCAYPLTGQRAALAVLNGPNEAHSPTCTGASPLLAVVGESGSAQSIVVSRILQPFRIPMISYFSSCACLSDRRKYPTFFRVIPNDDYQVKAIAQLLLRFNWTWVGLVRGDHEYGRFAVQGLLKELQGSKVCIAYQEMIPLLYNRQRALEIMQVMRSSQAKVVVVFSAEGEMTPFLRDYMKENITGIQWVASEAWVTASVFTGSEYYPYLGGTIGFGIRQGHIPKLSDYLQTVEPHRYPSNTLVLELWGALYGCSPSPSFSSLLPPCSGQETLLEQHSAYMNTSSPRVSYNVYKAVYAIAHALQNLLLCKPGSGPFRNNSCAQSNNIHPWQLQHYLQEVAFSIDGEEVNFDLKGDSIPYYDIINWQRGSGGKIEFVNVGLFDGTKTAGKELVIQEEKIMWAGHQSEVLVSVCSASCLPGSRKAVRRGEPVCCFDCVPCDSGKISNQTDSVDCTLCPQDFWSNTERTACIPKKVEFLTYDSLGIALTAIAVVGACLTIAVLAIFFYHKNTAIVSYFATCACLSDQQQFPSFFRTIPSDAFQVVKQNVTGLQWMASEAWTAATLLQTPHLMPYLGGTLGIAIRRGEIPGLRDFLLGTRPGKVTKNNYGNSIVRQFWEYTFQCRFSPPPAGWLDTGGALCTGQEDLESAVTEFLDVSDLRAQYNVYKAVYALAYALDDMLQCVPGRGPFSGHSCASLQKLQPWQLVHYLDRVNFTTAFGDQVSFDENGDALPIYDVMNWCWLPDGSITVHNVGVVKKSASTGEELTLDEDRIFWNFEPQKPPRSVCSESCPPGTRIARRKGEPVCCFDCIPCSNGKFSNETDSIDCISCPEDFWSSPQRDHCIPKTIEFLSYHEPLGICLTTASLLGTLICTIVLGVFIYHRSTPMVRANNSELSFLLLLSLKLCFLCSLLFIGRPRLWTCQLRHAAFGISFVLCVSCILVKTMVVLAVFKASKPGGGASLKWFGAVQQRGTVLVLTSIQAAICTAWLVSSTPTPHKNTQYHSDKIVYECVIGSTVGFAVLLGYIGFLAILSLLLAFLARNLPDNFNEAKLITFSMLIFCAVWVAFIPAYINSPGKYADAVEVFAIMASSFGLLMALFGPKCFIILLRPERNTKKAIMGRGTSKK
ncbi:extracellular calcium-sensing receptor-like [Myripristis murdjan]|uniref:extracellular calcium-sensing receptor-like n=1 Tax=Myripristis murdjan TaxID=586833 RepID=UPI0011763EB6|nr:extracellular calcium-sensing receptor-like [Myripristis murdjan]